MVPYYGRHSCKQYIKNKPVKFGYKIWPAATTLGYAVEFYTYAGKDSSYNTDIGLGGSVIINLVSKLPKVPDSNYHIVMYNFFTSPRLLRLLQGNGIDATGTLRPYRTKNSPLIAIDEMKKGSTGISDLVNDNKYNVTLVRWKDNKVVTVASTLYGKEPMKRAYRYIKDKGGRVYIDQPNAISIFDNDQSTKLIFFLSFAVAPDPVENCTIINKSSETFHLHCVPGFDGGMEQLFLVTVTERSTSLVRYNATARQLDLFIPNLRAGSSYLTTVTPMNKKGYGKTTQVLVDTLNHPAVELTQAEGAYSSSSSSSSESISDTHLSEKKGIMNVAEDWAILTGVLVGGCSCIFILVLVSVTIRYCVYHQRNVSVLNTQSSTDARLIMPSNSNNNHGHFGSLDQDSVITAFPPNTSVRKGILKRGINNNERCSNHEGEWGEESPDLIPPPPPPLLGTTSSSAELLSNEFRGSEFPTKEIVVQGRASFITKGESCTLPRRTSKEGILHDSLSSEANNPLNNINTNPISNGGSTDPLLQIPDELCAVLTLQRSSSVNKARNKKLHPSVNVYPLGDVRTTPPTLKKKRESIV
nr:uncharacterized protein LOC121117599 [Lepeophtheirus salmonis]